MNMPKMTEDYLRRFLPNKWAIDIRKLDEKPKVEIISVINF
jgi:hypothetical protein